MTDDTLSSSFPEVYGLSDQEALKILRKSRPARHRIRRKGLTLGARVADSVASIVGSWPFIIIQSCILLLWLAANIFGWIYRWDPYPFILLNLMLSFQAAYTAPIIMMAQNRQADIDRKKARKDYDVNLKSELEIELLHQKIDLLREQEIKSLIKLVEELTDKKEKITLTIRFQRIFCIFLKPSISSAKF
ncbi:MAG: DUF1003 domain-containing protein [Alphaproteobacteria bacterium]|nr:DUF1003 domain-containing protein [Alphaproteobacteria bacterium]